MEDIKNNKSELLKLINNYNNNYIINNNNLKELLLKHKNYMYLMKYCNINIIYKWKELKDNYKIIKSKIIKNDKIYYDIIKLYGNIICYYDNNENKEIEDNIKNIYNKKNNNIIELKQLSIFHKDIYYKHKLFTQNKNILTITVYSDKLNIIIDELLYNIKKINNIINDIKDYIKKIDNIIY